MTNWTFQNLSRNGQAVHIESPEQAIELFMEASGEDEYAVCLEFSHTPTGAMSAIAGQKFATLSYDPNYDPNAHSLAAFRSARPAELLADIDMPFIDDTATLSSVARQHLVPILDVVRAIQYILLHADYPEFLKWERTA